mmetsp:Transcript_116316/g.290416  ORF Transcript_116316/g.290416 Transcript_116316/m.290416 type:complete len:351 (-) Transcript_116316:10-1062(-)
MLAKVILQSLVVVCALKPSSAILSVVFYGLLGSVSHISAASLALLLLPVEGLLLRVHGPAAFDARQGRSLLLPGPGFCLGLGLPLPLQSLSLLQVLLLSGPCRRLFKLPARTLLLQVRAALAPIIGVRPARPPVVGRIFARPSVVLVVVRSQRFRVIIAKPRWRIAVARRVLFVAMPVAAVAVAGVHVVVIATVVALGELPLPPGNPALRSILPREVVAVAAVIINVRSLARSTAAEAAAVEATAALLVSVPGDAMPRPSIVVALGIAVRWSVLSLLLPELPLPIVVSIPQPLMRPVAQPLWQPWTSRPPGLVVVVTATVAQACAVLAPNASPRQPGLVIAAAVLAPTVF